MKQRKRMNYNQQDKNKEEDTKNTDVLTKEKVSPKISDQSEKPSTSNEPNKINLSPKNPLLQEQQQQNKKIMPKLRWFGQIPEDMPHNGNFYQLIKFLEKNI